MGNWGCQHSDCACSVCVHGCISVSQIVLSVWLSQQSKCVTVIWTAETRHVLMFAQPPTPICLQSHAKAAQSTEKNIQGKCSPRAMIPCLVAQKLKKTHSYITTNIVCVFRQTHDKSQKDISTQNSNWKQVSLYSLKVWFWTIKASLREVIFFSQYASSKKVQCFYSFSLI